MVVQTSFFNQLITDEQLLDHCIVLLSDPRWQQALQEWDTADTFALDIETYGEQPGDGLHPWKGKIRLIQIGLPSGLVIIADLGGWEGCKPEHRPMISKQFLPRLRDHLKNTSKLVLGMNLKFDLMFIKVKFGFEARSCRDVMLMSQVLWAGLPTPHSLKGIAERLGFDVDKSQQMSEWGFPLNNNQLNYAAKDVTILFPIFAKLHQMLLDARLADSYNSEMLALPCFVQMEYNGMPVDYNLLIEVLEKYQEATTSILQPFADLFPGVNPDSSQQVIAAVKAKLNIHLDGTAQEHLAPYWDKPELKALSLWRTITTYIDYLRNVKKCYFDGAVRGVYRQIAPKGFGRSTCGADKKAGRDAVNLQNPPNPNMMPKELSQYDLPAIRSVFRTTEEQLLISDLSAAHARIATDVSRDRKLIEIFKSGADLHCVTAASIAKLKGKDWDDKYIAKNRKNKSSPDQSTCELYRQVAKPTFYGSLNAQGWATLQKTAKTDVDIDLSDEDAKAAIKAWRDLYRDLYLFQLKVHREGSKALNAFAFCPGEFGEVRGHSNRRIFMPLLLSKYKNDKPTLSDIKLEIKNTDCVSFVWTSCEADIIKLAMGLFLLNCDKHPEWKAKQRNIAHDELDVTCNPDYKLEVATALQSHMRSAMAKFIKLIDPDDMTAKPESLLVNSWVDK
jgi:DNA polymerase I-like protein with 3'-5' exonuclease and polymerase domains